MTATVPTVTPQGIVLLAHGSRDPLWAAPVHALAQTICAAQPNILVRCAYLELMTPDLPQAVAQLAQLGARNIKIAPLFIGMGKHARTDLPLLMQRAYQSVPGIHLQLLPSIGENPELIAAIAASITHS